MYATIEPVSIWQGKIAQTGVVIQALVFVFPNVKARVEWQLCNATMQPIAQGIEEMSGADFDAWGSDDGHVYRWLCERLGLTLRDLQEPPAAVEPVEDPDGPGQRPPSAPVSDPGPGDFGFVEGGAN